MRTAVIAPTLVFGLLALAACSPREKPAEIATSAENSAASFSSEMAAVATDSVVLSKQSALAIPAGTCKSAIGEAAAQKLADRCIAVSPATHPPCTTEDICEIIQGEIDRACAMYKAGEKKPPECSA